jgi:hypothetical protein
VAALETGGSKDSVNLGRVVLKSAERASLDAHEDVDREDACSHQPGSSRIHGAVQAPRVSCGQANESWHVVIAADHPVERDNIGWGNLVGDVHEVTAHEFDEPVVSATLGLLTRGRQMCRGCVYMHGALNAVGEEHMMNDSNTCANVEESCPRLPVAVQHETKAFDEEPRCTVGDRGAESA